MEVLDQSVVGPVLVPPRGQWGEFIALPFPASTGCGTVLEPSHFQASKDQLNLHHITTLWLWLSCPSLSLIRTLVITLDQSRKSSLQCQFPLCYITYSQIPKIRIQTFFFLGEGDYFAYHRNHPRGKHRGKNNYTHPSKSQMQATALERSSSFPWSWVIIS